jgi:hypothetical protein
MRSLLPVAAAATLALAASAASIPPIMPPAPAAPPRLLIVLSVDQLSSDLWDEYRPHFTGGLARLAGGTVFRNGYQSHAATETCPGHSTILTGSLPARSGIIANHWYDLRQARSDKGVYCAEDERVPGSSSTAYTVSAVHLKVPTLGEILKARSPASLNVAVAGKDRAAVMMSGQRPDQRWYWEGKSFATDLKDRAPPRVVGLANAAVAASIAAPRTALEAPPLCAAKAREVAVEGGGKPVGTGRFARAAGDARAFRSAPEFDGAVLALAAGLIQELRLGADTAPDVLAVGLSATDYVGHSFGTGGAEMCLQLLSLDRELGDFFRFLDSSGVDYAVALTSDHGGQDIPERLRLQGVQQASRVQKQIGASQVGKQIGAKLGLSGPVLVGGYFGDVYIDPALKAADRSRALREALAIYRAHPQVEAAYSAAEIALTPLPTTPPDRWTMLERARAAYDPQRSGELVVLLRRFVTPIADTSSYVATHGSPWDYDRRVPILFWRRGMAAAVRQDAADTVDIMPTLAASLGLPVDPSKIDGKCLQRIPGIVCPPR